MPAFFSDLDDTLFSSRRKHRIDAVLRPEAFLANGDAISYSCAVQRALRDWMQAPGNRLVAVTARSIDAYTRTTVAGTCTAVCSNGAVILNSDGTPDRQWQAHMARLLEPNRPALIALQAELARWGVPLGLRTWLVEEDDLGPVYAVIKSPPETTHLLDELAAQLRADPPPWVETIHHNEANLAVIPKGIAKRYAVDFLRRERLGESTDTGISIGVGDSHSDWGFMAACHYALVPARSQIASALAATAAARPGTTSANPLSCPPDLLAHWGLSAATATDLRVTTVEHPDHWRGAADCDFILLPSDCRLSEELSATCGPTIAATEAVQ